MPERLVQLGNRRRAGSDEVGEDVRLGLRHTAPAKVRCNGVSRPMDVGHESKPTWAAGSAI